MLLSLKKKMAFGSIRKLILIGIKPKNDMLNGVILYIFQTQEKEAIDHMRRKAKEIQQKQKDLNRGTRGAGYGQGGFGSSKFKTDFIETTSPVEPTKPSYTQVRYVVL